MLLSRITKYELDMPRDEKVEFTMEQLIAFIIWSVLAYHEKPPSLVFNQFRIWREGEVIRIGDCEGCLNVSRVIELTSEMHTLMPYFTFPSEMSTPEHAVNSVRYVNNTLGYFDKNNESLLPVALQLDKKENEFYVICGEKFMGKSNFSRYKFKALHRGQV
jgi:hypothetical protein